MFTYFCHTYTFCRFSFAASSRSVAPHVTEHVPLTISSAAVTCTVVVEMTSPVSRPPVVVGGWVGQAPATPPAAVVVTTELDPNVGALDSLTIVSKFADEFDDGILFVVFV